jgi:hypothetical protein
VSYIENFAMNTIALVLFVLSNGCSNSPAESTTPRGVTSERTSAVHESSSASAPAACAPCATAATTEEPAPTPRTARAPARPAASTGASPDVRRLAVATSISGHEPVGTGTTFTSDNEQLFAFIEASNVGGERTELVVSFRSDAGEEVGFANITIPAGVARWRTWAWSRRVHEPGTWTAFIRTSDGVELARQRFEVEG